MQPLLAAIGLPAVIDTPVSAESYGRLWLAIAAEVDDEFFGMGGRAMRRGSFTLLCHCVLHAGTLEQMGDEQRRGGLPIGTGDRNQWTREEPNGELGLGDPAHPALGELAEHRSTRRDSRTDHDQPGACQSSDVVPPHVDRCSCCAELGSTS